MDKVIGLPVAGPLFTTAARKPNYSYARDHRNRKPIDYPCERPLAITVKNGTPQEKGHSSALRSRFARIPRLRTIKCGNPSRPSALQKPYKDDRVIGIKEEGLHGSRSAPRKKIVVLAESDRFYRHMLTLDLFRTAPFSSLSTILALDGLGSQIFQNYVDSAQHQPRLYVVHFANDSLSNSRRQLRSPPYIRPD